MENLVSLASFAGILLFGGMLVSGLLWLVIALDVRAEREADRQDVDGNRKSS